MSQKRAKQIRRQAKRARSTIEAEMVDRTLAMSWRHRIVVAWLIGRPRKSDIAALFGREPE